MNVQARKPQTVEAVLDEMDAGRNALARLRQPFPPNQISKLPKETKTQANQRKADQDKGNWPPKCAICDGYHHPKAVHLDYVGHAALTARLLDVDPLWSWEPVGFTPEGLPAYDRNGGLWIKLTVCGMTRYGYGAADGKTGGDAVKEMIGDALRNAAMRFGAALDLWHKGDLHAEPHDSETGEIIETGAITEDQFRTLEALREKAGVTAERFCRRFQIDAVALLPTSKFEEAKAALENKIKEPA